MAKKHVMEYYGTRPKGDIKDASEVLVDELDDETPDQFRLLEEVAAESED